MKEKMFGDAVVVNPYKVENRVMMGPRLWQLDRSHWNPIQPDRVVIIREVGAADYCVSYDPSGYTAKVQHCQILGLYFEYGDKIKIRDKTTPWTVARFSSYDPSGLYPYRARLPLPDGSLGVPYNYEFAQPLDAPNSPVSGEIDNSSSKFLDTLPVATLLRALMRREASDEQGT